MRGLRAGPALAAVAAFLAGGGVGLVAGVQWSRALQARWSRAARDAAGGPYEQRRRDPAQWLRDSARRAAWQARQRALPERLRPREVRRVQALDACAVSFEVRDTAWAGRAVLFDARAWDRRRPGVVIASGATYREGGLGPGDTATVVLPRVYCADLVISGYGVSAVGPPPGPVHIEIR